MIQPQYRKVTELKELEDNPRIISKKQFETLKKSLEDNKDYFEARPVILSDRTGELVVIAGNQRLRAAKALNMAEIPTVLIPNLTEEREKEIIIRDNVANGEWDFDKLANEWDVDKLNDWGINNIKKSIADEKDIKENPPAIIASFLTFDYQDEIRLEISEETAEKLMEDMLAYRNENRDYEGFWDERLKR